MVRGPMRVRMMRLVMGQGKGEVAEGTWEIICLTRREMEELGVRYSLGVYMLPTTTFNNNNRATERCALLIHSTIQLGQLFWKRPPGKDLNHPGRI